MSDPSGWLPEVEMVGVVYALVILVMLLLGKGTVASANRHRRGRWDGH